MKPIREEYKGFTISDDKQGIELCLDDKRIDESVEFMKAENIDALALNYVWTYTKDNLLCLEKFNFVKRFFILSPLIEDISPIYNLTNLEELILDINGKKPVDFSKFPKLKRVAFDWNPKSASLYDCKTLESVNIHYYNPPTKDLSLLKNLKNLKNLRLTTSQIERLDGVENLKNLTDLELYYLSKLQSLIGVETLKNLKNLDLESCKQINSLEPVKNLKQLKRLRLDKIGNIETLRILENLENLECLIFRDFNLADNNIIESLLKLHNLKTLLFPRKKIYGYTSDEILEMIKEEVLV